MDLALLALLALLASLTAMALIASYICKFVPCCCSVAPHILQTRSGTSLAVTYQRLTSDQSESMWTLT